MIWIDKWDADTRSVNQRPEYSDWDADKRRKTQIFCLFLSA